MSVILAANPGVRSLGFTASGSNVYDPTDVTDAGSVMASSPGNFIKISGPYQTTTTDTSNPPAFNPPLIPVKGSTSNNSPISGGSGSTSTAQIVTPAKAANAVAAAPSSSKAVLWALIAIGVLYFLEKEN